MIVELFGFLNAPTAAAVTKSFHASDAENLGKDHLLRYLIFVKDLFRMQQLIPCSLTEQVQTNECQHDAKESWRGSALLEKEDGDNGHQRSAAGENHRHGGERPAFLKEDEGHDCSRADTDPRENRIEHAGRRRRLIPSPAKSQPLRYSSTFAPGTPSRHFFKSKTPALNSSSPGPWLGGPAMSTIFLSAALNGAARQKQAMSGRRRLSIAAGVFMNRVGQVVSARACRIVSSDKPETMARNCLVNLFFIR